MLPYPLRDLVVREPELLGQGLEPVGLLDWIQVGSLQVLDEPEDEL